MVVHIKTETVINRGTGYADFTTNIRNLNSDDTNYPHVGLPYEDIEITDITLGVENRQTVSFEFTAADWGNGCDFYVDMVTVDIYSLTESFMDAAQEGIWVRIHDVLGATDTDILYQTYCYPTYAAVKVGLTIYRFSQILQIPIRKIAAANTLTITVSNGTGTTIAIRVIANGMPIAV